MLYFPKSQPAPESLEIEKKKISGTWRTEDVTRRISGDFSNKCYICGMKSTTFNVEHFVPHKDDINLKFDWNNLFWACGHCNNIKLAIYNNILNCTDPNSMCEDRIKYVFKGFAKEKPKIIPLDDDIKTVMTAELIEKVYDGTTINKQLESNNLLGHILNDFLDFQKFVNRYYEDGYPQDYLDECLLKIRQHLHHSSSFTEFKRWVVRENEVMKRDFEKFFI